VPSELDDAESRRRGRRETQEAARQAPAKGEHVRRSNRYRACMHQSGQVRKPTCSRARQNTLKVKQNWRRKQRPACRARNERGAGHLPLATRSRERSVSWRKRSNRGGGPARYSCCEPKSNWTTLEFAARKKNSRERQAERRQKVRTRQRNQSGPSRRFTVQPPPARDELAGGGGGATEGRGGIGASSKSSNCTFYAGKARDDTPEIP